MANVLETIVADKRVEVAQRELDFPLTHFIDDLTPSTRSLFNSLNKSKIGFIFECKKASPSKGLIREHFDLDEILSAYLPYAAGISVLTDEKYFQGKYAYLEYVTQRTTVPVLNKDFFISPYQVYLARYYQADAILLMLSVLSDDEYRNLAAIAEQLQLDVLTEVSNEEEMTRAIALEAKIMGINNRNLRDLSTDLATTERLVPMLVDAQHDFVVISESGIYTHDDVKRLSPISHGFLVGSALMAQKNLPNAVKSIVFGKNKVCGITQAKDATSALQAGATYLGFIFVPSSPRAVTLEQAKQIVQDVPKEAVFEHYVAVFRNNSLDEITAVIDALPIKAIQLHGSENASFRAELKAKLSPEQQLWQAVPMSVSPTSEQLELAKDTLNDPNCDHVLFDCKVGEQEGGTGQVFDWSHLADLPEQQKWILAGGIGEHNIASACRIAPNIIDINSCVESAPGIKDADAVYRTLQQTRCLSVSATHSKN